MRSLLLLVTFGVVFFSTTSRERPEQIRLRSHFNSVLVELGSRDVSGLSDDQLASRQRLIGWLGEYRDAGQFPLNDRYSTSPTPIFRDARGVTCAMAYLIERSGRRDFVERTAATQNLAYISELADNPTLIAWLDSVGLSVEEAGRVQPTYPPDPEDLMDKSVARRAMYFGSAAVATTVWSLTKRSQLAGTLGVLAGIFALAESGAAGDAQALGSPEPRDREVDNALRVVGSAALVSGAWAIFKPRRSTADQGLSVTPFFTMPTERSRSAVGLHVRF